MAFRSNFSDTKGQKLGCGQSFSLKQLIISVKLISLKRKPFENDCKTIYSGIW